MNLLWVDPRLFLEGGVPQEITSTSSRLLLSSRYLRKLEVMSGGCAPLRLSPRTPPTTLEQMRSNALLEVLKWSEGSVFGPKKKKKEAH